MAWVNLSGAFGYGTILTSTQMQNLRDNIAAAFAKDSGAPVLANDYITQVMLNSNIVSLTEIQLGSIMIPVYMSEDETELSTGSTSFQDTSKFRIYIPVDATTIILAARVYTTAGTSEIKLDVGGESGVDVISNTSYAWNTNVSVDVSSLAGWYDLTVQYRTVNSTMHLQGYSLYWA